VLLILRTERKSGLIAVKTAREDANACVGESEIVTQANGVEVHHPRHDRRGFIRQSVNAKATHFQQPREGVRRPRDKTAVGGLNMNAIVRHQLGK